MRNFISENLDVVSCRVLYKQCTKYAIILVQLVLVAETWYVLKKYDMLMQGVGGNSRYKQKNQSFQPVEEN